MAEFKSAPRQESKKATATPKQEGKIETSELEYSDNRSSTAQLVSLQSAADDKGNRSNTTQLQSKASVLTGASRVTQLKTASDLRRPASSGAPVQLKAGVPVNNDPKLEREADVMGAKALQLKTMPGVQDTQTTSSSGSLSSNIFQLASKGAKKQEEIDNGLSFENIYPEKEGMEKLDATEKPSSKFGEDILVFLVKLEEYIDVFESLDYKNLKKEKQNKDNILRLEKLGMALGYAALGLGIAAVVTAALGSGVGAVGLLVAGIGMTVAKTGLKFMTGKKKEASVDPTMSAAGIGAEALAGGTGAIIPGVGAGLIVLELGMQTYTVVQLEKDKEGATKIFNNLLTTVQKLENDITTNIFPKAGPEHKDKVDKIMSRLADLKVKIKGVDAGAKAGFEQVIGSDTVEM